MTIVCGQVVEYYKQALKQLKMSGARESRNWRDLKVFYYSSVSAQWVVGSKGITFSQVDQQEEDCLVG